MNKKTISTVEKRVFSPANLQAEVEAAFILLHNIKTELGKQIVGNMDLIDRVLVAILVGGHVLIEGSPGTGKTTLFKSIAQTISGIFQWIQFTPDLAPSDLTGFDTYNPQNGTWIFKPGTLLGANIILADEINRAPSKVQAALLQAMEELQTTINHKTYKLERPCCVFATQNPFDHEGVYPLPEAQLDRFTFKLVTTNPSNEDELAILEMYENSRLIETEIKQVVSLQDINNMQNLAANIYMDANIKAYIVSLSQATREPANHGLETLKSYINFGVSPRATIKLMQTAKAYALLNNRSYVTIADVQSLAHDVLRHRLVLSYEAEADGKTADDIIDEIIQAVPTPSA